MSSKRTTKNVRRLNKYERAVMFNRELMKVLFIITIPINLFLPMYKVGWSWGFSSLFQWAACLCSLITFRYGIGMALGQKTWLVSWTVIRVLEVLYYFVFHKVYWTLLLVGIITDLLLTVVVMLDRDKYEYRLED